MKEKCSVTEVDLLKKYWGLVLYDGENKVNQTIISENLEWRTRSTTELEDSYTGWYLISMDENGVLYPWMISQHVIDTLQTTLRLTMLILLRRLLMMMKVVVRKEMQLLQQFNFM